MANKENRVAGNVAGKYYVDSSCIACEACTLTAPENFRMKDDGSSSMVFKQPENGSENQACDDAKNGCPVGAIGDDGNL
ncbi:MAG: ferredoxin [Fibrobacter sp.]|nr:ferredoxin [Fibrobacter sp.]